jgi:hypothetical protein
MYYNGTDKEEYKIGDSIEFLVRFTNVAGRTVHIFIPSIFNDLGYVGLYNDEYYSFFLTPMDPVTAGLDVFIHVQGYYEGNVKYTIPSGVADAGGFHPLLPIEYLVSTTFFIEGRLINQFQSKFSKYTLEEWNKIDRGSSPKLDWFPNKYVFPTIKIIQ